MSGLSRLRRLGFDQCNSGQLQQSRETWTKVLEQGTREAPSKRAQDYGWRAHCCRGLRLWRSAISDLTSALELNPRSSDTYHLRALCYMELGEHRRAISDEDSAVGITPTKSAYFDCRANCYFVLGEFQRCIDDETQAISLDSSVGLFYDRRACAYSRLLIRVRPEKTRGSRGRGSSSEDDHFGSLRRQALSDHESALRLEPKNAIFLSNRAHTYYVLGEFLRASVDFGRAARLVVAVVRSSRTNNNANEEEELVSMRGLCYLRLRQWERAVGDFSRAEVLMDRKKKSDGAAAAADATTATAKNATTIAIGLFRRGWCFCCLGNLGKAAEDWGRATTTSTSTDCAATVRAAREGLRDGWIELGRFEEFLGRMGPFPGKDQLLELARSRRRRRKRRNSSSGSRNSRGVGEMMLGGGGMLAAAARVVSRRGGGGQQQQVAAQSRVSVEEEENENEGEVARPPPPVLTPLHRRNPVVDVVKRMDLGGMHRRRGSAPPAVEGVSQQKKPQQRLLTVPRDPSQDEETSPGMSDRIQEPGHVLGDFSWDARNVRLSLKSIAKGKEPETPILEWINRFAFVYAYQSPVLRSRPALAAGGGRRRVEPKTSWIFFWDKNEGGFGAYHGIFWRSTSRLTTMRPIGHQERFGKFNYRNELVVVDQRGLRRRNGLFLRRWLNRYCFVFDDTFLGPSAEKFVCWDVDKKEYRVYRYNSHSLRHAVMRRTSLSKPTPVNIFLAGEDEPQEPISLPFVPRIQVEKAGGAQQRGAGAVAEPGSENEEEEATALFLRQHGLDAFVEVFQQQQVKYNDFGGLVRHSAMLQELIPRIGPRSRFIDAVEGSWSPRTPVGSPVAKTPPSVIPGGPALLVGTGSGSMHRRRRSASMTQDMISVWLRYCPKLDLRHFAAWDAVLNVSAPFAQGAFGSVKEAVYGGMNVAVKDILLKGREFLQMAVEEFLHLISFQHEHVVRVFSYSYKEFSPSCRYFRIVMEKMDTDLRTMVTRIGDLEPQPMEHEIEERHISMSLTILQKFNILRQCANVLRFLHSRRTLHRDVKAENFLCTGVLDPENPRFDAIVKIADFGLAKIKRSKATKSRLTATRGTMLWMAPEVIPNSSEGAEYGFPADIYSFACLTYEVLYGVTPWRSVFDPLREKVTNFNLYSYVSAGSRPSLSKLEEACPEFASFIGALWHRPVLEEYDSMEKVCRWFVNHESLMKQEYASKRFNDRLAVSGVSKKKEFGHVDADLFPTEDWG